MNIDDVVDCSLLEISNLERYRSTIILYISKHVETLLESLLAEAGFDIRKN